MKAGKKNKAVGLLSNAEAHGLLAFASLCILGETGCGTGSVALVNVLCTHGLKESGHDNSDAQGTQNSSPTLQPDKEQDSGRENQADEGWEAEGGLGIGRETQRQETNIEQ